jgi:hypothetical protein
MKWKVHLDRDEEEEYYKAECRYSITTDKRHPGWNTDSGYVGYGLPKELAQWICDILNEHGKNCPYTMQDGWWDKNEME